MNLREMLKEAVENSDVKVFVYDRHKVDKDILFDYINRASDDELGGFMSNIRYVQGATGEMCRVAFYDDDKTLAVYGLQICKMGIEGTRKRIIDNDIIIKALECCSNKKSYACKQCPYYDAEHCIEKICSDALSLIKCQKEKLQEYK